jgi:peptidoglycan/LPS O-acetylase OafA/YrhL
MGSLRLVLALSVLLHHCSYHQIGVRLIDDGVAVQLFFMISGFYIALILNEKYIAQGSIKRFYYNRFLRLFPVYWSVLVGAIGICVIYYVTAGNWRLLHSLSTYAESMTLETFVYVIFSNIAIFNQDLFFFMEYDLVEGALHFSKGYDRTGTLPHKFLLIPQAWSISIELIFYAAAPFIVRHKKRIVVVFMMGIASRLIVIYGLGYDNGPWEYRFAPSEMSLFMMGAFSYHYMRYSFKLNLHVHTCLIISFAILYPNLPESEMIKWILFFVVASYLPSLFLASKYSKVDRTIGDLSYPVYLVHSIVLSVMLTIHGNTNSRAWLGLSVSVLSIFISFLILKFISNPIEKIRNPLVKR